MNLTQSREERQEKYGVTTLRALRLCVENKVCLPRCIGGAALGIIQVQYFFQVIISLSKKTHQSTIPQTPNWQQNQSPMSNLAQVFRDL